MPAVGVDCHAGVLFGLDRAVRLEQGPRVVQTPSGPIRQCGDRSAEARAGAGQIAVRERILALSIELGGGL
jgi:hypothetical protein